MPPCWAALLGIRQLTSPAQNGAHVALLFGLLLLLLLPVQHLQAAAEACEAKVLRKQAEDDDKYDSALPHVGGKCLTDRGNSTSCDQIAVAMRYCARQRPWKDFGCRELHMQKALHAAVLCVW